MIRIKTPRKLPTKIAGPRSTTPSAGSFPKSKQLIGGDSLAELTRQGKDKMKDYSKRASGGQLDLFGLPTKR